MTGLLEETAATPASEERDRMPARHRLSGVIVLRGPDYDAGVLDT
jgi:hypothetical protein